VLWRAHPSEASIVRLRTEIVKVGETFGAPGVTSGQCGLNARVHHLRGESVLRKLLTGAVVASASLALTAAAIAQEPAEGTFTASASPSNAGTKKKPKNTKLSFSTSVTTEHATAAKIVIKLPNQLRFSGKGFKRCDEAAAFARVCPAGSAAGPKGVANALAGRWNDPAKTALTLDVYPYVEDNNTFLFYLDDRGSDYANVVKGEITNNGSTITILLHEGVRQPVEGLDASLVSIQQTFSGKRKGKYIVSSVGCKKKKWTIGATITFAQRADGFPPPGPMTKSANVRCSK
jgi:hypothetical protein